jgi:hypothetical protein
VTYSYAHDAKEDKQVSNRTEFTMMEEGEALESVSDPVVDTPLAPDDEWITEALHGSYQSYQYRRRADGTVEFRTAHGRPSLTEGGTF